MTHIISIDGNGGVKCIYSDDLADYIAETGGKIKRASSVEPDPNGGGWLVDLTPVGGKSNIGPFRLREDALKYEVDWLERNWLNNG